jgi:hypothetical protein
MSRTAKGGNWAICAGCLVARALPSEYGFGDLVDGRGPRMCAGSTEMRVAKVPYCRTYPAIRDGAADHLVRGMSQRPESSSILSRSAHGGMMRERSPF